MATAENNLSLALAQHENLLPPVTRELIRVLSWDKALALTDKYGGVTIYVPETARQLETHYLYPILGESLRALIREFSAEHLTIPKAQKAILAVRNNVVREDRKAGLSIRQIAMKHKLTERWVHEILGKEVDNRQLNLDFD
jgi:Mor family transcriptional regulator